MNAFSAIVAAGGGFGDGVEPVMEDGFVHVGMVRLWGRDLAIRAEHVREVVLRPAALQPAFSSGGALVGSVVIRAQAVPVVDISSTLGFTSDRDPEEPEPGVIVVLRHQRELIGLLVHSVLGLNRVRAADIQQFYFHSPRDSHVVASSFAVDDRLIGLIDLSGIANLHGVPRVREMPREGRGDASIGQHKVLMLSVAGAELAVDAALVAATVPGCNIRPAPSVSDDWVGVVHYLDQEVPVVDDIALLGLSGRAVDAKDMLVVVLRLGENRLLGLKADRVRRIVGIRAEDIRALPAGVAHLPLFAGAISDGSGGQSLLLRSDALTQDKRLQAIARLTRRREGGAVSTRGAGTGPGAGKGTQGLAQAYLIFRIGGHRRACLLADISQIIPLPRDVGRLTCPGSSLRGLASYRSGPLTLVDLGTGEAPPESETDARMVLVVEAGGSATGFVVDGLDTTTRAVAQPLPPMIRSTKAESSFIQVRIGGREGAVHVCSLRPDAERLDVPDPQTMREYDAA